MTATVIEYSIDEALDESLSVRIPRLAFYRAMLLDQYHAGDEGSMIAHLARDTPLDEIGYSQSNDHTIRAAYFPNAGRACIIDNAGTTWTDASSVEDAIERYRTNNLQP